MYYSDAAHEIHHIPKAHCEFDFFFFSLRTPDLTERAWLRLISDWDAKKWHQNPRSPTPTPLLRPNPPVTLLWIGHPQRVRPGRLRNDERRRISNDQTRGEERGETNGSDGGGGDIEGGKRLQKQQQLKQENKQHREKTSERKERGAEEAQRHPRSSN